MAGRHLLFSGLFPRHVLDIAGDFRRMGNYKFPMAWFKRQCTTTGKLTELQNQSTGTLPVSMALHPSVPNTGQYLYTSNSASANIIGFTLSTTSGAMSNPITVIAPEAPSGMAVH